MRIDTQSNWSLSSLIPILGELCYTSDTHTLKVGNGVDAWHQLPYTSKGVLTINDVSGLDLRLRTIEYRAGESLRDTDVGHIVPLLDSGTRIPSRYLLQDWLIKTSAHDALAGQRLMCDTTSAAFTVTLPPQPAIRDVVTIADYAGTFATNNLTVARNGKNIENAATDLVLTVNGTYTLEYIDATKGWAVI